MKNLIVELTPDQSEQAYREILVKKNERHSNGVKERLTFGYVIDNTCLGILSLEFPFKNTANIYWMGIRRDWHQKGIDTALLRHAEMICIEKQVYSLTIETLSPKENDDNALNMFEFYIKMGFKPLFEVNPYGSEYSMIYLNKVISPHIFDWIDLTHEISENTPTWDGDCGFKHINIINYEECATECKFLIQRIEMLAGVGTHIDAPAHCFPGGKTVDELSIQTLILPCIVVDLSQEAHENYCINMEIIKEFEKRNGKFWKNAFVIFNTGWGRFWNQPKNYRNNYSFPCISKEVAQYLVTEGIMGIGIDTLSPDLPESGYPVHQIMLGSGKFIVENISNAHLLPATGSYVFIMPLRLAKGTESPIRLLGMLQKSYKV